MQQHVYLLELTLYAKMQELYALTITEGVYVHERVGNSQTYSIAQ